MVIDVRWGSATHQGRIRHHRPSSNPSSSAITINGSGAAMSHTKSQEPRSHTRSTMPRHRSPTRCSISEIRRGVKPRFTRPRRRRWSGSSIEIIIGRGWPCGRGARRLENVAGAFSMASTSSYLAIPHTSAAAS